MPIAPVVPMYDPLDAAPHPETGLRRGRQGRPKLKPRGINTRVEYTRASALAGYITSSMGLEKWTRRLIARGAGIKPQLARMAAAEDYDQAPGTEKDALYKEAGQNIDTYIEGMIEAAGGHDKANWGTAVHSLVRPGAKGVVAEEDVEVQRALEGFAYAMEPIERLASEVFVANDELLAAGTFDGMVRLPTLPEFACVADWKTGEMNIIEHIVQLAVYANGELYDVDGDDAPERDSWRTPLDDTFGPVSRDIGLLVRPAFTLVNAPVEKRTNLYLIDLAEGMRLARVAAYVRQMQKTQSLGMLKKLDHRELRQARARQDMLALGPDVTRQALSGVHARWKADWTAELTEFGAGLLERIAA